jgi:uroporphyrinogen decarboxylase
MNSKDRVIRTLDRERPDRVPMTDSFWEDTITRWYAEGLPQEAVSSDVFGEAVGGIPEFFGFDFDYVSLDASPRLEQKLLSDDGEYLIYQDRFGYTVKKSKGKSRTMDFMDHVTKDKAAWEQVKGRFVLDPDDTARVDQSSYFMHMAEYPSWEEAKRIFDRVRHRGRYVLANAYGPWEATWRHRGFTELLMDLVTDPEFVIDMAETYMDLLIAVLQRCLDDGIKPDGVFMVEDLAYKTGMLMSPRSWRQIFKPLVWQLGQFLRTNHIDFWMHCCGNAEAIFEDLIECGLQVIQPLEAKSGLDVRELRQEYGDRLTFWGNINVINMANGTDQEIEEEIRTKISPFIQDGGGYIYHSDHSVPPEVSFERYQLVLDLVRKYGAY